MKILLIVGSVKDVFIYNMAKWLKASMNDVIIDVFEFYPNNNQQYDYAYYNKVCSVQQNWCTDLKYVRIITSSFREAQQLDLFLKDKYYDIIQCHWIRPAVVLSKQIRAHCGKLFITFWGNEYALFDICLSKKLYKSYLGLFLKKVDCLLNSKKLIQQLGCKYPSLSINSYPVKLGAASLDYIYSLLEKGNRVVYKSKWTIPESKYCTLIGYSGKSLHQHLKVIDNFVRHPVLKDKIHLLAVMTRGQSEAYVKQVEDALSTSGYTYTMVKGRYLTDEEVASLRYVTDITMQLSSSDGFSRSIVECLCAKSLVLYGAWLNYDTYLEEEGFTAFKCKTFEDAFVLLEDIVQNYPAYYSQIGNNPKAGRQNLWSECIKNWVYAYTHF